MILLQQLGGRAKFTLAAGCYAGIVASPVETTDIEWT